MTDCDDVDEIDRLAASLIPWDEAAAEVLASIRSAYADVVTGEDGMPEGRLADVLSKRYGDEALEMARRIEAMFPSDRLAPMVTAELERRLRGNDATAH